MGKMGEESLDVSESALKKARLDADILAEGDLDEGEDSGGNEEGGEGKDLLAEEEEEDTCVYGDEVEDGSEEEDDDSEEDDASDSDEEDMDEELVRYRRQIEESDGFDVDFVPQRNYYLIGLIYPIDLDDPLDASLSSKLDECARKAVTHYNKFKKRNLVFLKVLKGTRKLVAGRLFYVTFQAKDLSSGEIRTYQTKVYYRFNGEMEVTFFRTKPENVEASK